MDEQIKITKTGIYNLIQQARANVDNGTDADLAIVLLVDKYNKLFNTTDDGLEQSLREYKNLSHTETFNFLKIFRAYEDLQNHLPYKTNETVLKIYEPLAWILSRTILLLHRMEYLTKAKAADKAAAAKRDTNKKAEAIWRDNKLGREKQDAVELKRLYKEETGKNLQRKVETIHEQWIPFWRPKPI